MTQVHTGKYKEVPPLADAVTPGAHPYDRFGDLIGTFYKEGDRERRSSGKGQPEPLGERRIYFIRVGEGPWQPTKQWYYHRLRDILKGRIIGHQHSDV